MDQIEQMYHEYMPQVYRYLFSLCHNSHLAEELTQETFYQALKSIKNFRGDCKLYVWLCQIAKHVWIKELNRKKREMPLAEVPEPEMPANGPEDVLERKESVMEVYKSLHQLKEPMREVMHLRLSGEFSFKEIGEIMERDENWARVTYYRGKIVLRRRQDEM